MGTIRLLFALSVLIFHAGQFFGYNITNNTIAVVSFFIISGFYMALILEKKYTTKNAFFIFISNRFLRIFPLYWITLLTVFLLTLIKFFSHVGMDDNAINHYIQWSPHDSSPLYFYLNLGNYIARNITLLATIDYVHVNDNTPGYLLVQQAWTLQIELLFYLVAPFLMKQSKKMFVIFSLVYGVGFFAIIVPKHMLPPNLFYIFLNNLIFFLLGVASYRFIYQKIHTRNFHPYFLPWIFIFFLFFIFLYNPFLRYLFPLIYHHDVMYYIILTTSLPFIFLFTNASFIDAFIGKLSYPVYITHFIIIKLFSNLSIFKHDSNGKTILIIIVTLLISHVLVKYIENPIDKYRQSRLKNHS